MQAAIATRVDKKPLIKLCNTFQQCQNLGGAVIGSAELRVWSLVLSTSDSPAFPRLTSFPRDTSTNLRHLSKCLMINNEAKEQLPVMPPAPSQVYHAAGCNAMQQL